MSESLDLLLRQAQGERSPEADPDDIANALKGWFASLIGGAGDMASMGGPSMQAQQAMDLESMGAPSPEGKDYSNLGTSDWFGQQMGADTESIPYLVASLLTPTIAGKGAKAKKVGKKVVKAIGNMWDEVTDPAQAAMMARRGKHIKRNPAGEIVGAPPGVGSPQSLAKIRRDADRKIQEGEYGMDWYQDSRDVAEEFAAGDPVKQALHVRGGAAYSPQAQPRAERAGFLRQHNAKVLTGEDIPGRTKAQMRNVARAYVDDGKGGYMFSPESIKLGRKTGPYAEGMDPNIPDEDLFKTANDIQHGRLMGYGEKFSRGFTPQEHGFLIGENLLLADRARKADEAAGRTRTAAWTPKSAQAAGWVVQKREKYIADRVKKYDKEVAAKVKENRARVKAGKKPLAMPKPLDMDALKKEATDWSVRGQRDAANYNSAFITQEARPGAGIGHLEMGEDEQDLINTYTDLVRDTSQSTLPSLGMFAKERTPTRGYWNDPPNPVERNPGWATQALVSRVDNSTPKAEMVAMQNDALINALMDAQKGGGGSRIHTASGQKVGDMNSVLINGADDPGMRALVEATAEKIGASPINYGDTTLLTKFGEEGPVPGTTRELLKALADNGVKGNVVRGKAETFYEPTLLDSAPGEGTATRNLLDRSAEFSKDVRNLEERTAPVVANRARVRNEIDAAIAAATGKTQRQDLRKLRDILATGGVPAVRKYVAEFGFKGLPAVLLGYLGLQAVPGQSPSGSPDA